MNLRQYLRENNTSNIDIFQQYVIFQMNMLMSIFYYLLNGSV